jgi:hypothetical protein
MNRLSKTPFYHYFLLLPQRSEPEPAKRRQQFLNGDIFKIGVAFRYIFNQNPSRLARIPFRRDEAQNATEGQLKMFLTRMGKSAKFIITGDVTQVDLPKNQKSGLVQAMKILKDVKGIEIVELDGRDVIRHKLVKGILKAYEQVEPKQ